MKDRKNPDVEYRTREYAPLSLHPQFIDTVMREAGALEESGGTRPCRAKQINYQGVMKTVEFARSFLVISIVGLICTGSLRAQQAHYGKHGPALLPDSAATPGSVAITSEETVCTTKWGQDARHVTGKMKKVAYVEYGTAPGSGVCLFKTRTTKTGKEVREGCEIDHLISRELGGADAIENLWPQPYTQHPGAHEKDWLENELHREVCAGKITLDEAQTEIKDDWYAAYLKRHPGKFQGKPF